MTKLPFSSGASPLVGLILVLLPSHVFGDDTPTDTISPPKIPAVTDKAPDFTLRALDGTPVTLSKLTANSPVVLVVLRGFPGYQCPICATQVSGLIAQAKDLAAAKAHVLLVYPGPTEGLTTKAGDFMHWRDLKDSKLPENFSYVTDPDYRFTLAYALRWDAPRETAYPSTFVIDREGVVRYMKISMTHGDRAPVADILKALAEIR